MLKLILKTCIKLFFCVCVQILALLLKWSFTLSPFGNVICLYLMN